jgi:uncharacterized FAD-dependent dehydrogenase
MTKKIAIVGAGPAGYTAAKILSEHKGLEVLLIDQGKRIEHRNREIDFDRACGFAGVGAYSDGKHIFDTIFGKRQIGENLHELVGEKSKEYMIKAKEIFREFYVPLFGEMKEITPERLENAKKIATIAGKNDMDYILAHGYHIGTDRLPEMMFAIQSHLEKNGVSIITSQRVVDFDDKKVYTVQTDNPQQTHEYDIDYLLIAPGRDGSIWLEKILQKKNIAHTTRPIDLGFRIETDSAVLKHLTDIERDVKLEFRHPNGDLIRTFCVCPYGEVSKEGKDRKPEFGGLDFCLVNGASDSKVLSNNTNFALLVRMPLREESNNANWGIQIAKTYKEAGADRITLQRLGDLKQERSSKPHKLSEWRIQPTLKPEHYMIGDVRIGMPARIMDGIRYGIKKLSAQGLMEGLDQDSTLLYGPEIKMHGINIATNTYLASVSMPNLYLAGDGTGFSRGIGGAMASGIRAAEGILIACGYL